jgi:transcription elongation factor GreA
MNTTTTLNQTVQLTKDGHADLVQELSELQNTKRPAAVARVQTAREFGDLSENAEYHAAREELNFIDGRIEELEEILSRAKVVSAPKTNGVVGIGCKVTVSVDGQTYIFHVVGEWEANPSEKKISHDSPLGKALLGRKVGEKVEVDAPAGKIVYTIKKIH